MTFITKQFIFNFLISVVYSHASVWIENFSTAMKKSLNINEHLKFHSFIKNKMKITFWFSYKNNEIKNILKSYLFKLAF